MSFFVDDDDFQESTEFKCQSNDTQRAYRVAVERALAYARGEGVSLVAALGNSDVNGRLPDRDEETSPIDVCRGRRSFSHTRL